MAPAQTYEQKLASLKKQAEYYADYMSDEEEEDAVATQKHDEDDFLQDFSMCVVVGGLPVVDNAKHAKLLAVVKKIFSQVGAVVDLSMPFAKNGSTTGFALVAYEQEAHANDAVRTINNFALDKRHTLLVNKYSDLDKFNKTPAAFVEPKIEKFVEPKNLKNWLTDSARRDMFVLRHGTETEIFWSDKGEISLDYDGEREKSNGKQWCSQYVLWSPHGTFLATFHPQGLALWAGEKYEKVGRFAHKNVKIAVFSPNEKYLLTLSETESENAIIIWDVKTSKMLRAFPAGKPTGEKGEVVQGLMTPFKWSADDKYIARRGKDVISIYELPSMKLLEKKSLKADGVHDFFWSPTDPIISYWAPEGNNVPARVSLVEIPSRREIRQKNLFNVSECKLNWHPNGTFLGVKVTRHSKSKKTLFTNFEMFRVREPLVPVEMLEMKDTIVAFAWEPKGTRFATVHGEGNLRLNVSFYDMNGGAKNNEITLLYTLNDKPCSHLYWSPHGNNIVLAGLGEINGSLEFWDADEKQSITIQEHFKCTHVEWDPSGRVVASSVCQPLDNTYYKFQMDNGYNLWTFQGKLLKEEKKDAFYQFLWRPRPRSLLSDKEYADVVKHLKKYEKRFNEMDRLKERERIAAEQAEKNRLRQEFQDLVAARVRAAASLRKEYVALLGGYDSDDEDEYIVETHVHDEIVSKSEEVSCTDFTHLCLTFDNALATDHLLLALLYVVPVLLCLRLSAACVLSVAEACLILGVSVDAVQQVAHVRVDHDDCLVLQRFVVDNLIDVRLTFSCLRLDHPLTGKILSLQEGIYAGVFRHDIAAQWACVLDARIVYLDREPQCFLRVAGQDVRAGGAKLPAHEHLDRLPLDRRDQHVREQHQAELRRPPERAVRSLAQVTSAEDDGPLYHAWIDKQCKVVLPARNLKKENVHYNIQCSLQDYLRAYYP